MRDRYEKGFIVEFIDGTKKLIRNNQLRSYEIVPIPDPDNSLKVVEHRLVPYNQDYILYTSPQTKYGMVPTSNIKDLYQVKYKKIKTILKIFDAKGNHLFDLS